jgi:tetratricopeptide (TPR) repeat protein
MNPRDLKMLIDKYYENISDYFNYKFLAPEQTINRYRDIMMSEQQYEKAFAFYELNMKSYPKSYRVFEPMGDFYRINVEGEKAIDYYRKFLSIQEINSVRRKLNLLLKEGN